MFDIGFGELLVLAVLGLFVFGPEKLPKLIMDVTRTLREVRRMAQGAQRELTESMDVDLKGIDLQSLDPRTFVRRTLMEDDLDGDARSDRERLQRGSASARSSSQRSGQGGASRSGAASRPRPKPADAAADGSGAATAADDTSGDAAVAAKPSRRAAPWDDDIT